MAQQHTQRAVRLVEGWLPRDLAVHGPQQLIFLDIVSGFPLFLSHHSVMSVHEQSKGNDPDITCWHAVKGNAVKISKVAKAFRCFGHWCRLLGHCLRGRPCRLDSRSRSSLKINQCAAALSDHLKLRDT